MKIDLVMADLFCGAGGTSTGAVEAAEIVGRKPKLTAINHWPVAVETHALNHPEARHLCTNIDEVNPRKLFQEGELDLMWASPECRFHSVARGGKPVNEQGRPTAFCVPRWLEAVRPRFVLVENVPEFVKWGPKKDGTTFKAWFNMNLALGYVGDWRIFCAADYGDPTSRKRLIVQFVRKGSGPVVWPDQTHLDPEKGAMPRGYQPWVPASEIVDWKLKGRWLDEMPGKPRFGGLPISPKTLARVYAGFEDHSGANFIVKKDSGERRTRSLKKPLHTICASSRSEALVEPFLVEIDHQSSPSGTRNMKRPLSTVTTKARHCLVESYLVQVTRGNDDATSNRRRTRSLKRPINTICAGGNQHALLSPYIVDFKGTSPAQVKNSGRSLGRPITTITTQAKHVLIEPWLVQTAHGDRRRARSVKEPLPTVTGRRGDLALCSAMVLPQNQGGKLRPVARPLPTIATSGAIALLEAYLVKYYGTAAGASLKQPLDTITTKDRFALVCPEVVIQGKRERVRFRWRMLQPHELAPGQGFRRSYQFAGNKSEKTKQIGNAVPRRLARALVLARLTGKSDIRELLAGWKETA